MAESLETDYPLSLFVNFLKPVYSCKTATLDFVKRQTLEFVAISKHTVPAVVRLKRLTIEDVCLTMCLSLRCQSQVLAKILVVLLRSLFSLSKEF